MQRPPQRRQAPPAPEAPVLGAHDQVVAARVHRHARDHARPRHQLARQGLLGQVVHAHLRGAGQGAGAAVAVGARPQGGSTAARAVVAGSMLPPRAPPCAFIASPRPRPRPAPRPGSPPQALTFWCVATKKKGLEGWKSTRTTRPRFLRNGFWLAPRLSWCTSTACRGGRQGGQAGVGRGRRVQHAPGGYPKRWLARSAGPLPHARPSHAGTLRKPPPAPACCRWAPRWRSSRPGHARPRA